MKEILNRIVNMFSLGRVTGNDDSGTAQQIQYQTALEVATAHRIQNFGFSAGLPVNTDVLIAFIGGDRSNPVIIGSNNQQYRHTGLKAGESVVYNQWGMTVLLTEDGITINAKGKNVEVVDCRQATISASESIEAKSPLLKCTGDIVDNCETNTVSLKQLRDAYNSHVHTVKNVESGSSDITSEKTGTQLND